MIVTTDCECDVVRSFEALVAEVKRRQVLRPRSRFALHIDGGKIDIKVLANGFVELDGEVPSMSLERDLEAAIQARGAVLGEVLG